MARYSSDDFVRLHHSIEQASRSDDPKILPHRSVTVQNADVPALLYALRVAVAIVTGVETQDTDPTWPRRRLRNPVDRHA